LLAFAWCAASTSLARASGVVERASLNWVRGAGADGCVSPGALAAQVESWLGPVFVAPAEADLAVEGMVVRSADAFEARITLSRRDGVQLGERTLHVAGDRCEPLTIQAAFVIAITIDPEATMLALPPEVEAMLATTEDPGELLKAELARQAAQPASPDPLAEPAPPPVPQEMAVPPGDSAPGAVKKAALPTWQRQVRLGVGFVWGALPSTAATLLVSRLWARRWLGFDLALGGILPRQESHSWPDSGLEHSFRAGALRVRAGLCHRPLGERWWLLSCLSASASWYIAPDVDVSPLARDLLSAFTWGGHIVAGLRLLDDVSVALDLELEHNPSPVYFRITPPGEYAADEGNGSPVRVSALLGGVLHF
jgi:hypothetical protein